MVTDRVARLLEAFRQEDPDRPGKGGRKGYGQYPGKLSILSQLDELDDTRIVPFLASVAADGTETDLVRIEILDMLSRRRYAEDEHALAGRTVIGILKDDSDEDYYELRNQAALAVASVMDIPEAFDIVRRIVLDSDEDEVLRASAFDALRHRSATAQTIAVLRELVRDPDLGMSAADLLHEWGAE